MSSVYKIKKAQTFPISISQEWDFFSSPANLPKITPPDLGLTLTSVSPPDGGKMYTGQIIEYTVKPVLGIAQYWMTEITHVEHEKFFIDEQRVGPYSIWHEQHLFKETDNGI